jgi:TNF receptor-associated protein 1
MPLKRRIAKVTLSPDWQRFSHPQHNSREMSYNRAPRLNFCTSSKGAETREFQAETRKLLDIVTHSIYTDKEVFIRELISNASDALEKYRYKQLTGSVHSDASGAPLEINILTDAENGTLILYDNGIGMSRDELISNLGTIARSGSKQFVEQLKSAGGDSNSGRNDVTDGIIGQFGVGFYSSFMVSDSVAVESVSAASNEHAQAHRWSSDGSGKFTIESIEGLNWTGKSPENALKHGSRIVMKLKESCKEYADADKIRR